MTDARGDEKIIPFPVPSDRAWFDPQLLVAACEFYTSDFALAMATSTLVAPADPMRIAIGFFRPPGVAFDTSVGPWPTVDAYSFFPASTTLPAWVDCRDNLLLPALEWYAYSGLGGNLRVVTVRRR